MAADDAKTLERLHVADYRARVEPGMIITVEAYDWNCPQHITPRFSEAQVMPAVTPLKERIAELEAALAARM